MGVLEMTVSHRAPSNLNMSSCRAIWTCFRSDSMLFINLSVLKPRSGFQFPKKLLKSDAKANIVTDKIIPGMAYPLMEKFVTVDSNLLSVTLIP